MKAPAVGRTTRQEDPATAPTQLERILHGTSGKALVGLLILLYGVAVLRTAWLCDDAYITFRTVGNFISGYGLTWNIDERVQAYTHPLWMFLLSGLFCLTANIYYSAIFGSIALSLAAVLIYAFGIARTIPQAILGLTILLFSKAFVDYSTGGLENPLSYLLLGLFLLLYLRQETMTPRRLLQLALLAGLLVLNRMDLLLLVVPALGYAFWQNRGLKAIGLLLLGFAPFVAWEIFSVIYYGFAFPNTAYAKLNTGIAASDLIAQGLYYFANTSWLDPVCLPAIGAALLAAVLTGQRGAPILSGGVLLYLLYILKIGGDFMSGRFFTVPLLAAVAILGTLQIQPRTIVRICAVSLPIVILLGLCGPRPSLLSGRHYDLDPATSRDKHGISDERAYYYHSTGLLRGDPNLDIPNNDLTQLGVTAAQRNMRVLVSTESMGILGYYAGPSVHIVDVLALPDPLLARLPIPAEPTWRIGHFRRFLPDGYSESLRSGRNELTDLRLRRYYDKLRPVISGDIFSPLRWQAIRDLNLGRCEQLIDREYYRQPPMRVRTDPQAVGEDRYTALLNLVLPPAGVWVHLNEPCHAGLLEIAMDRPRPCRVLYPQGAAEPVEQSIPADPAGSPTNTVQIPDAVSQTGFDRVLLRPVPGDDRCYIGQIRVRQP